MTKILIDDASNLERLLRQYTGAVSIPTTHLETSLYLYSNGQVETAPLSC